MSGLDSHFKDSSSWLALSGDDLWDDQSHPLFSMPSCLDGPTQAIKWKGHNKASTPADAAAA